MKKVLAIAAVPALFAAGLLTIYYAGNNGLRVLTDTEAVVGIPYFPAFPAFFSFRKVALCRFSV